MVNCFQISSLHYHSPSNVVDKSVYLLTQPAICLGIQSYDTRSPLLLYTCRVFFCPQISVL